MTLNDPTSQLNKDEFHRLSLRKTSLAIRVQLGTLIQRKSQSVQQSIPHLRHLFSMALILILYWICLSFMDGGPDVNLRYQKVIDVVAHNFLKVTNAPGAVFRTWLETQSSLGLCKVKVRFIIFTINDFNLIDEFEEDLWLLESDDNTSHSEDENDRQIRLGNLRTFYSQRRKIFDLFDDEKTRKPFGLISHPSCTSQVIHLMDWFLLRITKAKRRIIPFDQVLIALQFYGTRKFQTVLKREFAEIARIPGIIGCIVGTHIRIQRPHQHEYAFVNKKGYHSINVQSVCDANGRFLSVNATKPGSVHDSIMFKTSALGLQCVQGEFGEGFLLGDSGYGCTPYLITPFNIPSNDEEV
ncbi:F14D2.9-like protein [Daphnia magna]|uniref:F14D2.9-like protein n=1 Tax=Daphnia magna TaxID=35525 RepID=A0A164NSF9_9CRUS|nr:F14D2.9-like protein [Daphnia magna]